MSSLAQWHPSAGTDCTVAGAVSYDVYFHLVDDYQIKEELRMATRAWGTACRCQKLIFEVWLSAIFGLSFRIIIARESLISRRSRLQLV